MRYLLFFILGLYLPPGIAGVISIKTDSFSEIASHYQTLVTEPKKAILVFDIDDTLLTMSQPLGGVAWFDWQNDLLKNHPDSNLLFIHNFKDLVKTQNILFQLIKMDVYG